MKLNVLIFSIVFVMSVFFVQGQTDPGTANLIHQYTFDDGTANDAIEANAVNGTLEGGATISNNALILSSEGQYLSFPGDLLKLDTFTVITQEIWFTPKARENTYYTMLSYFGGVSNDMGYQYISTSVAREDDISRVAITNGTYSNEIYTDGPEYDDDRQHQLISIFSADSVILYIDGVYVSGVANSIPLSIIDESLAFLGKGGYMQDPTWKGQIAKFNIYNKSLSASEVKYLYEQGAEQSTVILATKEELSFDEYYKIDFFRISGFNLTDSITVTSPDGIKTSTTKLPPNATSAYISVVYDDSKVVDGVIELKSDTIVKLIPVKSYTNDCYTKTYETVENLVPDPYISNIENFDGWGSCKINTDHEFVYCGATSGMVQGISTGSLDVDLLGKLKPNTTYRIKAKVYAIGGDFQVGVSGWSSERGDLSYWVSTTDEWEDVDFLFTTGPTLDSDEQLLFFNNYNLAGTTGYIDNWEMYEIPKVYTSESYLYFPTPGSKEITVRAVNLTDDITLSTTEGFTVTPDQLPADATDETITVSYNHNVSTNGVLYFESGSIKDSIPLWGSVYPTILLSKSIVSVDEINDTVSFQVTSYNLANDITITAPDGISLSNTTITANAFNEKVNLTYDGIGNSSGMLNLVSDTTTASIELKANRNDECFTPLFSQDLNLIVDPTCNSYTDESSGDVSITSDPDMVYCGSRSAEIWEEGMLMRDLTGIIHPNSRYRVKAMAYKDSPVENGNLGELTYILTYYDATGSTLYYMDSVDHPEPYRLIKEAMDSACSYYSKYAPFIEEQILVVYDPDEMLMSIDYYQQAVFFGGNTDDMWVGTAIHNLNHYFGVGTDSKWKSLMVGGEWQGEFANDLVNSLTGGSLNGNKLEFWPFGINSKEEVTDLGSIEEQEQYLINSVKVAKAMLVDDCNLPTNNPQVGVGVYGWSADADDITHEVFVPNSWQEIDFEFITGDTLGGTQGVYLFGGYGYFDNWELYELEVGVVSSGTAMQIIDPNIYYQNGKIVTEMELAYKSMINISVYDVQGKMISNNVVSGETGINRKIIGAPKGNGIYIVQLILNGITTSKKVLVN